MIQLAVVKELTFEGMEVYNDNVPIGTEYLVNDMFIDDKKVFNNEHRRYYTGKFIWGKRVDGSDGGQWGFLLLVTLELKGEAK
jgi:hypothetical protein